MRGVTAILSATLLLGALGCSEPGPAERAGEAIDDAVEDAREGVEEAAEEVEEAVNGG